MAEVFIPAAVTFPPALGQAHVDAWIETYTGDAQKRALAREQLLRLGPMGLPAMFSAFDHQSGYARFLVIELIETLVDQNPLLARTALRWAQQYHRYHLGQTRAFLIYCWGKTFSPLEALNLSPVFTWYGDTHPLVRMTLLNLIAARVDASRAEELKSFLSFVIHDPNPLLRRTGLRLCQHLRVGPAWLRLLRLRPLDPQETLSMRERMSLFA